MISDGLRQISFRVLFIQDKSFHRKNTVIGLDIIAGESINDDEAGEVFEQVDVIEEVEEDWSADEYHVDLFPELLCQKCHISIASLSLLKM